MNMHDLRSKTRGIPLTRPSLVGYEKVEKEFREIWNSKQITLGKYTRKFEASLENYLNVRNVIAVSSCTSGLMLAIKALELSGEVIVPSFTFAATVHALLWGQCTPVFADCEEGTYCIDPSKIKSLITKKTTAIMPVYVYGHPPNFNKLQKIADEYGLKILSDAASALGAKYRRVFAGGFGNVEVFSLSPTKVLSSAEGGLVTTNDDELARRIRLMRNYGKSEDGSNMLFVGLSARMSEFHAIIGWKNLQNLNSMIRKRNHLIARYKKQLKGLDGISFQRVSPDCELNGNYMIIFVDPKLAKIDRDQLRAVLAAAGIQTRKYFDPPVHKQTAYAVLALKQDGLRVTARASRNSLVLPLHSNMTLNEVDVVCHRIKTAPT